MRFAFKSFDRKALDTISKNLIDFLDQNGVTHSSLIPLPRKIERKIVLTSPHVYKNAREQFGKITHKVFIDINMDNQEFLATYLENFEVPAGIGVNVRTV